MAQQSAAQSDGAPPTSPVESATGLTSARDPSGTTFRAGTRPRRRRPTGAPRRRRGDFARNEGVLRITEKCIYLLGPDGQVRHLLIWPAADTRCDAAHRRIIFRNPPYRDPPSEVGHRKTDSTLSLVAVASPWARTRLPLTRRFSFRRMPHARRRPGGTSARSRPTRYSVFASRRLAAVWSSRGNRLVDCSRHHDLAFGTGRAESFCPCLGDPRAIAERRRLGGRVPVDEGEREDDHRNCVITAATPSKP